ncbi:hypothetical protein FRB96_006174 [Tulasnella sp. 330]|nr:hypothetical protein FRB96_006174 [Tulasnella sp. 330]
MADALQIDEASIPGDTADLTVYRWLLTADKAAKTLPIDDIKSGQSNFEATLVKLVTGAAPFPNPGRPLRNLAARCFVTLYNRAETKARFETVQSLLRAASDFKTSDDVKVACLYCTGEIMLAFGSQIMSCVADVTSTALRLIKSSMIVRYWAFVSLGKSYKTAGRAFPDPTLKDISKQARNALTDKALPIQRAAAELLLVLHALPETIRTVLDVEQIINPCIKSLESADQPTRRALSHLGAQILSLTQIERAVPVIEKKAKKDQETLNEADTSAGPAVEVTKPLLSPTEMLYQLSIHFNKLNATRKLRIGLFDFYASTFSQLGTTFVEMHYGAIVKHIMSEIITPPRSSTTHYDTLLIRKLTGILMRDLIGMRLLGEQGQIEAIKELAGSYLRRWPALMPGQSSPSPNVLVVALKEVAGLLQQLGNAPPPVQDALSEPLVHLLAHPNYATQVAAAWCLRCFCQSTPLRLPKVVVQVTDLLQRDITSLGTPPSSVDVARRALGHAYGLAALFAVVSERPLYVSYDLAAKVFDLAIQLLKRAGEHDVSIAGTEVEVAWTCISSLMALGPNFIRTHLPQLLVLWRNALPKPTSKDTSIGTGRSSSEWSFLLQVREAALGAILSFLRHNSPALVTLDVSRRLALLLANALTFSNAYASQQTEETSDLSIFLPGLDTPLAAREAMLRRRVYQCFTALGFSTVTDAMQSTLLQSTVSLFASPEGYAGSSVQAAIASSSGNMATIWQMADGYAYGVASSDSTRIGGLDSDSPGLSIEGEPRDKLNRDTIDTLIDNTMTMPIMGSCENDTQTLCRMHAVNIAWPEPPPALTGVVDAAIELFAALLPLQDVSSASHTISHVVQSVRSLKLERNLGRKSAAFVNAAIGLLLSLRNGSHVKASREVFGNTKVATTLANFIKVGLHFTMTLATILIIVRPVQDAILDGDPVLRRSGSEALGRLAGFGETAFLTSQTKFLVDQVVSNRDPHGRAGCALAFGAIYSHVGGLVAASSLTTTVNVLMSLGKDPHPVVHYWALTALSQVINAASLSFAPYVSSTMVALFKLYMAATHEPEGGSLSNVNLSGDLPTYQVICQIIDAVIGVLGPELQEVNRVNTLVLDMMMDFWREDDDSIRVEAIKCIQHFLIFQADAVDVPDLVAGFRKYLSSSRRPLKIASINALYQLVQRDALLMSKLGGDRLVEDLFGMLDDDPGIDGVRNIILSWLQQTVALNPSAWIDLCQRIMSRTTASQRATEGALKTSGMQDDEAESLSVGTASNQPTGGLTSRWRTQLFALQCLHHICVLISKSGRREHLDLHYAVSQNILPALLLVSRVPDLIKMAFSASATYVTEIRLEGLVVLRDVVEVFARSPDPDYPDVLLLEQHQAPITAALTPAFSSDSTPEILAAAVQVCATFIGCGVVKDVQRMGRILKLLTTALEQSKDSDLLTIGDIKELSPNASVMLRIATLAAWAELQVASSAQSYLLAIIDPYRATLASLWIASLRDYAGIKGDSEVLQDPATTAMDSPSSSMGREVLLPYYDASWWKILKAVACLMALSDKAVLVAMDGQVHSATAGGKEGKIPAREEPLAYFFVVFGLVFEALTASDSNSSSDTRAGMTTALETLKYIVRPEYAGGAVLDLITFDEMMSLAYRLVMTETAAVQIHLVSAIASLASSRKDTVLRATQTQSGSPEAFCGCLQLTQCLKICAYVLRHAIPTMERPVFDQSSSAKDRITLISTAFQAFLVVGEVSTAIQLEEVRALAVSLYADLLKYEKSEIDLCGPTFTSLKAALEMKSAELQGDALAKYQRLLHGLLSACLQNIDEMRGRQGPAALLKVRNNLQAVALVLTVIPVSVKISQAVVEHSCYLVTQNLNDINESSITAAHCAKALVLAAIAGSPVLTLCVKMLIPGLIRYIAGVAATADDLKKDLLAPGTEDILRALVAFFRSVDDSHRARFLGLLLPLLVLLLDPAPTSPTPTHSRTVTQLLELATLAPAAFKEATAKLDEAARETMETSIRQALGPKNASSGQSTKPQISLRSF